MKKIIFIFIILFSVKGFAILPPLYHSLNEIKAITSDERLSNELGSAELILEIKKNESGYLITTNKSTLQVDVIYIPQKMIGPGKFELKFYDKKPKVLLDEETNELLDGDNKYIED
ncbi:MAG: hypothetical protein WCT85_01280 [Parachlamydiales bacterium]|jgi:hypothetical protein